MFKPSLILALLLAVGGTCLSQRLSAPRPARLRITVSDGQGAVRDATVELQDGSGFGNAASQKITDQDGRVEFNTTTGMHHVRITGAGIYALESDLEITPVEDFHTESIRVKRKAEGVVSEPGEANTVAPVRLKIPDKARKEFERGSKSLEEQDWEGSCKHFQAAIDLYPDYDLAYNGLGVARSQLHDTPAAREAFVKATQLNSKFPGAQRNLARILLSEHNYEEVAALLNQSLDVEPTNAWALTNAAYAELQLHRFQQAADHALRVHDLPHSGLANTHMIAGYALQALGQNQKSIAEFKLYLKEDPKGPNAKHCQEMIASLQSGAHAPDQQK